MRRKLTEEDLERMRQCPEVLRPSESDLEELRLAGDEARFWGFVSSEPNTRGCMLWVGTISESGYGMFWSRTKNVVAHRWAYERFVKPVPEGLVLDHLCRVRSCCNPSHLEPVTMLENLRRGEAGSNNREKTHCVRGHAFSEANTKIKRVKTVVFGTGRARTCRACEKLRKAERGGDRSCAFRV